MYYFFQLVQAKDVEITKLRDELREMKKNYDDIANFCEESVTAASELEEKTAKLKVNQAVSKTT